MVPDTVLTTQELSEYLKLNEKTVLKMAQSGELPGFKVGNQWRFYLSIVDEYLQDKIVANKDYDFDRLVRNSDIIPLSRFVDNSCIELELKSKTRDDVLYELSEIVYSSDIAVNAREVFVNLKKREDLLSTHIGNGVAVPHLRNPSDEIFKKPGLIIGRSVEGIQFSNSKKSKTHLFFVPCAQDVVLHLKLLAKIADLLRNQKVFQKFMDAKKNKDVLKILLEHEMIKLSQS